MIRSLINKIKDSLKQRVAVLMYHRIAKPDTDPWQLAVSPENFEEQLQVLSGYCKIISIGQLGSQLKSGSIPNRAVCLTFDDAYYDNFKAAKPLLEKYKIPATFYVPSAFIGQDRPFWWDELEHIILHSFKLPDSLEIKINNELFQSNLCHQLLTEHHKCLHRQWNWPDDPPTQRCELYIAIWQRLQILPLNDILGVIHELREWADYAHLPDKRCFPMTKKQLRTLQNNPLFTLGVHTHTHLALAAHPANVQAGEVNTCGNFLETNFGKQADTIAYPYGNYNDDTLGLIRELKFSTAFTTREQAVTYDSDPASLGRFQVKNWNGSEFEQRLRSWTS